VSNFLALTASKVACWVLLSATLMKARAISGACLAWLGWHGIVLVLDGLNLLATSRVGYLCSLFFSGFLRPAF